MNAAIEILGPFQVRLEDGSVLIVPQAHQRIVLAALALAGDRGMTADSLLTAIWDGEEPRSARKTLHGYITRLRRLPSAFSTTPKRWRCSPGGTGGRRWRKIGVPY